MIGEIIETAITELVTYCKGRTNCESCPFHQKNEYHRQCKVNIGILEDLIHYTYTELLQKEKTNETQKEIHPV